MKSLVLTFLFLMTVGATCMAQERTRPDHRISIRLNTLGVFNLDVIGDVEYSISQRLGVFAGGGSEYFQSSFPPTRFWFKKESEEYCKRTNWGAYAGMRISIPIWKLKGLSLRPYLFYQRIHLEGDCFGISESGPIYTALKSQEFGIAVNVAYTQIFAKRFFVEPAIGFGPEVVNRDMVPNWHARYLSFVLPMQLNLGVRF